MYSSWLSEAAVMICVQTAVLAAMVWVIAKLAKNAPARFRYALWLIVLLKFLIPPSISVPAFWESAPAAQVEIAPTAVDTTALSIVTDPATAEPGMLPRVIMPSAESAVQFVWAMGAAIMLLLLCVRYIRQRNIILRSAEADDGLRDILDEAAAALKIRRVPELRLSDEVPSPALAGLLRPAILLPSQITGCSPDELKAMFMHELAHVRRRDMAVNWLYQVVRIVFFFHPAVWLVGKEIAVERELACDELIAEESAMRSTEYAAGYVAALKIAGKRPAAPVFLGMAEPFRIKKMRLEMMLRNELPKFSVGWVIALALIIALGLPTLATANREDIKPAENPAESSQDETEVVPALINLSNTEPSEIMMMLGLCTKEEFLSGKQISWRPEKRKSDLVPEGIRFIAHAEKGYDLLIYGTPKAVEELKQIIAKLDVKQKEVFIKAEFVESRSGSYAVDSGFIAAGKEKTIAYIDEKSRAGLLEKMKSGDFKLINSPILKTSSGSPASTEVNIPAPGGEKGKEFSLTVVPRVNDADGSITLFIKAEFQDQEVSTTVRVPNGETIALLIPEGSSGKRLTVFITPTVLPEKPDKNTGKTETP